jgi:glycosyltransferase involved in cell wall biosynthesis
MADGAPAVSVLMPVLNPDPKYFLEAVRSVLSQTFEDFELLIMEEPSPCSAGDLLKEFSDPRIRHIFHPQRTSFAQQLNRGLAVARGELIARFDADDICEPARLQRQVDLMRQQPEVGLLGTNIRIIDSDGNEIGFRRYPSRHEEILAAMPRYLPFAHPSVMFRRRVVVDLGGYGAEQYSPAEDYDLWSRIIQSGVRAANCDEFLVRYRMHRAALKFTSLRKGISGTVAVKEIYWGRTMKLRDRLYLYAERALLLLPGWLVYRIFVLVRIRRKKIAAGNSPSTTSS